MKLQISNLSELENSKTVLNSKRNVCNINNGKTEESFPK